MELSKEIGKRIKDIRGSISQTVFAEKLKVTQPTLGRYERGSRSPDAEFILLLHKNYNVNPNWLITGVGEQFIQNGINSIVKGNQTQPQLSRSEKQISFSEDESEKLSKNHEPSSITELITKTIEILESETVYSGALSANIKAFHEATRTEKRLCELQATMESNFKKMDDRMAILEAENNSLRKRLKESPDNGGGMAANQG